MGATENKKIDSGDELRTVAIMPWLHLKSVVTCFGVKFTVYERNNPPDEYRIYKNQIDRILSSYRNLEGEQISECVLLSLRGADPCQNLNESELNQIKIAIEVLAFCALSKNMFFSQVRHYTNRTFFDFYFQRFLIKEDQDIAIRVRRRDGSLINGGFEHGKVLFSVPIQCSLQQRYKIDENLLLALEKVKSPQMRRIKQSIMLFNQANTDSDSIMTDREIVLLASAYEQLFDDCFGADDLACKVSTLMDGYGSRKVGESDRKKLIKIKKPEEKEWHLNRKWMQELYHLRNTYTHGNDPSERTWGWSVLEHLVMATFFFPRIVKMLLAQQSLYVLSKEDKKELYCIDNLLELKEWAKKSKENNNTSNWENVLQQASWDYA